MAAHQNYTVYKNSDWEIAVRWESDGTPYILSAAEMKVRRADTDVELISLSSSGGASVGSVTLDLVNGWAVFVIEEEQWDGETYTGNANYDIKVTRASDSRTKILVTGQMVLRDGYTR